MSRNNPTSDIGNKIKRQQVFQKIKQRKEADKRDRREKRRREAEDLGEDAPAKQVRESSRRGVRGAGPSFADIRPSPGHRPA